MDAIVREFGDILKIERWILRDRHNKRCANVLYVEFLSRRFQISRTIDTHVEPHRFWINNSIDFEWHAW